MRPLQFWVFSSFLFLNLCRSRLTKFKGSIVIIPFFEPATFRACPPIPIPIPNPPDPVSVLAWTDVSPVAEREGSPEGEAVEVWPEWPEKPGRKRARRNGLDRQEFIRRRSVNAIMLQKKEKVKCQSLLRIVYKESKKPEGHARLSASEISFQLHSAYPHHPSKAGSYPFLFSK